MFNFSTKFIWIGVFIVFLCMCFYIHSLREDNRILSENNVKLEMANQENQKYIDQLKTEFAVVSKSRDEIRTVLSERDSKIIKLTEQLENVKRLEELSKKKPTLIENRINKGTKDVFDAIIRISKE